MKNTEPEIIEAEIVEDNFSTQHAKKIILGVPTTSQSANKPPAWPTPHDHARPQGDTGGVWGGFFTLAAGMFVTVCVLIFSIVVLLPLALIGRLFGLHIRTFKR